ncbi:hypothetical protein Aperf_G00000078885 [Anoplocephala perfoliata]
MDPNIEIEEVNDYATPRTNNHEDSGSFFYKLIVGAVLFIIYFFIQRFSASMGARIARHASGADRRNYDEEMREARRRLQERFDEEQRRHKEMKKDEKPSTTESKGQKPQSKSLDQTKTVKRPKPELLRESEYFPLMGDTSSSRVCFRRGRNTGG